MDKEITQLSDAEIEANWPNLVPLLRVLDDIARRDPNPNVSNMAFALSRYFRTPDSV